MTEAQVIALINQWIIANGNNEITADVLRPILLAMIGQPNDVTGDLSDLSTGANANLVAAINWLNTQISEFGGNFITLHQGTDDPNVTPPSAFSQGDFYLERLEDNTPVQLWQYNIDGWKLVVAGAGDQDNQFIPYKINIVKGDTNMAQRVAIKINSLPSFTVTEKQIPLFYVREFESDVDSTVVSTSVWGLAYIGKGTYGFGGTTISSGYLLNISPPVAPSQSTVPPDAVRITISGGGDPEDILNAVNPPIYIQAASDTPTIITTDDGVYWWLGAEGTYGVGGDTAVSGDFQLLENNVVYATEQFVEDGFLALSGNEYEDPMTGSVNTIADFNAQYLSINSDRYPRWTMTEGSQVLSQASNQGITSDGVHYYISENYKITKRLISDNSIVATINNPGGTAKMGGVFFDQNDSLLLAVGGVYDAPYEAYVYVISSDLSTVVNTFDVTDYVDFGINAICIVVHPTSLERHLCIGESGPTFGMKRWYSLPYSGGEIVPSETTPIFSSVNNFQDATVADNRIYAN